MILLLRRTLPSPVQLSGRSAQSPKLNYFQDLGKGGAASTLVGSALDCLHPFPTSLHKTLHAFPPPTLFIVYVAVIALLLRYDLSIFNVYSMRLFLTYQVESETMFCLATLFVGTLIS